jgi:uncharacterized protein YegJ (DUF2314 family)
MKTALTLLLATGAALNLAAQDTTHMAGRDVKSPGAPGYLEVPDRDKAMRDAVDHAHQTLGFFVAALKAQKPDTSGYEIKSTFIDGDQVEHIWIDHVTCDGKVFRGRVNNKPLAVHNVRLGQRVTVEPRNVSDWMFIKDGKLMGGFTTRILYARLSPEQKAQFAKEIDFTIE